MSGKWAQKVFGHLFHDHPLS